METKLRLTDWYLSRKTPAIVTANTLIFDECVLFAFSKYSCGLALTIYNCQNLSSESKDVALSHTLLSCLTASEKKTMSVRVTRSMS